MGGLKVELQMALFPQTHPNGAFGLGLLGFTQPNGHPTGCYKSWCLACKKKKTRINGNHRVVIDHNPQWTLGDNPLYLEKQPECQSCFDSDSRLWGRFMPGDEEVSSIMPRIVSDLAYSIVDLDRNVRWLVMKSVLRASERKYRFAKE